MLKRLVVAVALSGLVGCSGVSSDDIIAKIDAAQKVALKLCGYLPYADVLRKIFAANDTSLKTAEEAGKAVCAAMTAAKANKTEAVASPPKVGGVEVEGMFVKPEE